MRIARSPVPIVERIYDIDQPAGPWLASIRHIAERSFAGHIGVQTYTFEVDASGQFRVGDMASDEELKAVFDRAHELASPDVIREIYLRRPLVSLTRAISGRESDSGYQQVVGSGIRNISLALGVDPGGQGCALVFAQRRRSVPSRQARWVLERLAAHLGAAHRLRMSMSSELRGDLSTRDDAVLDESGAVLHAERKAREAAARGALCAAARRIDKARAGGRGLSRSEALSLWRTLVDGRWSLVERFDSDGRRLFIARRNDPTVWRARALLPNERKVIALLSIGHSLKLCAYELGFAQSTVSELAAAALRKLGVRSRAELVELYGTISAAAQRVDQRGRVDERSASGADVRRTTHGRRT